MEASGKGLERQPARGASLVEVALIVAVVAFVALVAIRFVGGRSSDSLDTAGQTIHAAGDADGGTGGAGPASDGGGGGAGTATGPPPTADPIATTSVPGDVPPTAPDPTPVPTTAPTTTTTPTTTTAPPTTTTTPPPQVATAALADATSQMVSSTAWRAGATLTLEDQHGTPVAGATVTIRVRTLKVAWNGTSSWVTTTLDATVDPSGHVALETGPYKASGGNRITKVEYTITDVVPAGDGTWDGVGAALTVPAP